RPHQFRAAAFIDKSDYSSHNRHALSIQPTARCHLCVSLVIGFDDEQTVSLDAVAKFLGPARLAGGSIVEYGAIQFATDVDSAISLLRRGFAIHDRTDLLKWRAPAEDALDALLRLTEPGSAQTHPWLVPTTLGFAAITDVRCRSGVRED